MVDCQVLTECTKNLIVQSNRLILQSKGSKSKLQILFDTKQCKKLEQPIQHNYQKKIPIIAIYGLIDMQVNSYLVVVTKAILIGQIYHKKIYQISKMQFICVSSKPSSADQPYIQGLQQIFATKCFYFSNEYDLTLTLQQIISKNPNKIVRKQYMFNFDWIDQFIKIKAYEWITGFISGYISIAFSHGTSNACQMALISRRDKRRQGMRYLSRGCDLDGNSANTAQTQLIFFTQIDGKQNFFSFVQLRGSMPFRWSQDPDLRWSPKCTILNNDKLNADLFSNNYSQIKKYYQNATMVNLIDKKGSQLMLGKYFQKLHNNYGDANMKLIWFDFHAECKNMKYENLSKLLDIVSSDLINYGYLHFEKDKQNKQGLISKKSSQKGIFRTNCVDCLDRTNVVQSVFARKILLQWLYTLRFQNRPRQVSAFQKLSQQLQQNFRKQWTQNADKLSILYSGTPAMKTDFTATGQRTTRGSLNDGYYAVKRYFLGNFYDSRKQDMIDFSLNQIKPKKHPHQRIRNSMMNSIYIFIVMVMVMPIFSSMIVSEIASKDAPTTIITIILTIVLLLLLIKGCQMMKQLIVRRPIKK